jgi:hypothetical protein
MTDNLLKWGVILLVAGIIVMAAAVLLHSAPAPLPKVITTRDLEGQWDYMLQGYRGTIILKPGGSFQEMALWGQGSEEHYGDGVFHGTWELEGTSLHLRWCNWGDSPGRHMHLRRLRWVAAGNLVGNTKFHKDCRLFKTYFYHKED